MIQEIITKIEQSIQCVLCYLLNLCFQPIYCILQIVQGIIDIWDEENVIDPEEPTVYPEIHEVKGFHINTEEQAEVNKIKKQLKNNGE